jgi:hypothetical protein
MNQSDLGSVLELRKCVQSLRPRRHLRVRSCIVNAAVNQQQQRAGGNGNGEGMQAHVGLKLRYDSYSGDDGLGFGLGSKALAQPAVRTVSVIRWCSALTCVTMAMKPT